LCFTRNEGVIDRPIVVFDAYEFIGLLYSWTYISFLFTFIYNQCQWCRL